MSVTADMARIVKIAEQTSSAVQDLEAPASLVGTMRTLADPADIRRLAHMAWPEGGPAASGATSVEDAIRREWIGPDGTTERGRCSVRVLLERLATELELLS
jgi:hypothetical protein